MSALGGECLHIDEETEALALLRVPGCPGAQPAQAFLPHWSLPARPALAGLPDSIFCHLHCQQAGTGHVGGAWTALDGGPGDVSWKT